MKANNFPPLDPAPRSVLGIPALAGMANKINSKH